MEQYFCRVKCATNSVKLNLQDGNLPLKTTLVFSESGEIVRCQENFVLIHYRFPLCRLLRRHRTVPQAH